MAYRAYQIANSGIHFSKFLLFMATISICLEASRKKWEQHIYPTTEDTVSEANINKKQCQCEIQCRRCALLDILGARNATNTSNSNSSSQSTTREHHELIGSHKETKETDFLSYFVLFSTTMCVGTSSYIFGVVYVKQYVNIQGDQFGQQSLCKTLTVWCGAPMGLYAVYMLTLIVFNHFFLTNTLQWYIVSLTTTCFMIPTNVILLLSLASKVFKGNNDGIHKNPDKRMLIHTTMGTEDVGKFQLQNEDSSWNPREDKSIENNLGDQVTPIRPLSHEAQTELLSEEYNQLLQTLFEDAQKMYDNDSPCNDPSYLKIWCRAFANSLNEDVDVHFDRNLFKTAKKFKIELYSEDGNNLEKRCKEHHQKLRVVTFKLAYEAMEGWQKYGHDFPLEEYRSLILSIAAKWMTVVQECIAKEETKEKIEGMGPDDEQKAWFRKAVVRQQELNLNGMQEGSGSKLMFDKWVLMGVTFGSLGGKMMMKLIGKSG